MTITLDIGDFITVEVQPQGFVGLTPCYLLVPDHPDMDEVDVVCSPDSLPVLIGVAFGLSVSDDPQDEGGRYLFEGEVVRT